MLSEKELIDGQRWLACWEKFTSKPMTSRETLFASAIESAACAERDARIAHLEATASANYKRGYDDAHSMLVERIAELEQELEKVRQQMEAQKAEWLSWEAKRKTLEMDAERWAHACKGNNKQINVCSWDNDAYEFVGYAMKKNAIDAIADAEIAAMKGTP